MNLLPSILAAFMLMMVIPATANAHLVTTGLGPFYDGTIHLFMSPDDLLGLLALVLLAGLRGKVACRLVVIALSLAWLAAGLVGLNLPMDIELPWLSVFSLVVIGALVAVNPPLPPTAVASLAGLSGAVHGLLNGSALAAIGAGALSMLGIAVTVMVVSLLCGALIVPLKADWTRMAIRVAGSWVAAVGLLMLGWLVKGAS
jgi:hydrogenase/urease accessory protein HupE